GNNLLYVRCLYHGTCRHRGPSRPDGYTVIPVQSWPPSSWHAATVWREARSPALMREQRDVSSRSPVPRHARSHPPGVTSRAAACYTSIVLDKGWLLVGDVASSDVLRRSTYEHGNDGHAHQYPRRTSPHAPCGQRPALAHRPCRGRPMKSRRLVAAGATGLVVAMLAACGGGDGGNSASSMYTWISNASDRAQWEAFVTAAQQEDPEFDLRLEGPSFEDYWTTVHTRMGAADAPCILTTQAARARGLDGILMPLDDLAAEHGLDISMYNDAMIEALTVDGTVRAIPYDAEPVVLYYNKDRFAEAGLDEPGLNYTREQ